ncbi:MAG: hypothetical protein PVJ67_05110 [Candidatus Pacearchaeota archaeon]|jgi:hypothetical protein
MKKYYDKNGLEIKPGMYLEDEDGLIEKVYYNRTLNDLGFNPLNRDYWKTSLYYIDSLSEFNLMEWQIHKMKTFEELQKAFKSKDYYYKNNIFSEYYNKNLIEINNNCSKYALTVNKKGVDVYTYFSNLEEVERFYSSIISPLPF